MNTTNKNTPCFKPPVFFPPVAASDDRELYTTASKKENHHFFPRKRGADRDDSLLRIAIDNRKQQLLSREIKLEMEHAERVMKSLEIQKKCIETYTALCEQEEMSDDALAMFKENICKLAAQSVRAAVE